MDTGEKPYRNASRGEKRATHERNRAAKLRRFVEVTLGKPKLKVAPKRWSAWMRWADRLPAWYVKRQLAISTMRGAT